MSVPTHFYVSSFISILHFISDDLIQCDASTKIAELFCEEFDDLDFELALCCFESTHKMAFQDRLWQVDGRSMRSSPSKISSRPISILRSSVTRFLSPSAS